MLAVEVQNLTHSINNKKILNNINFNLNKDSISCILGPSGSGKTTLLKLLQIQKREPTQETKLQILFLDT
mgnify:CR=1 FL=1